MDNGARREDEMTIRSSEQDGLRIHDEREASAMPQSSFAIALSCCTCYLEHQGPAALLRPRHRHNQTDRLTEEDPVSAESEGPPSN